MIADLEEDYKILEQESLGKTYSWARIMVTHYEDFSACAVNAHQRVPTAKEALSNQVGKGQAS